MNVIYILWLREVKRYVRSRVQIIFSLAQPTFYLLAFGLGFGPVFEKAGEGSYLQFLAPGIVGMTVLLSSMFSGIAVLWDRQFGFLKETLVAPVPRIYLMIGRTLGGATIGMIQGALILLVCLIAGFRPQHWVNLVSAFSFVTMIAIPFAALGMTLGSMIQSMEGLNLASNFLRDAHVLSVRRSLSIEQSVQGPQYDHAHRSALLRRGWSAGSTGRCLALQLLSGQHSVMYSGGNISYDRRLFLLANRSLKLLQRFAIRLPN